jgi:hypothetical protein
VEASPVVAVLIANSLAFKSRRGCYQLLLRAYGKVATRLYEERLFSRTV